MQYITLTSEFFDFKPIFTFQQLIKNQETYIAFPLYFYILSFHKHSRIFYRFIDTFLLL